MTPYYDQDGVTIYHGDCYSVPWPENVALMLTDPPYGISYVSPKGQTVVNDDSPFDPRPFVKAFDRSIVFGANYFSHLLPPSGWLVWSKTYRPGGSEVRDSGRYIRTSSAELAWVSFERRVHVFNHWWAAGGFLHRESERGVNLHPTQKPAALMRWIVDRWTQPGELVFDPFMGSGPVLQACHDLGRRYIGIEIEEKYCEIAVQRLAQGVLTFEDDVATTN